MRVSVCERLNVHECFRMCMNMFVCACVYACVCVCVCVCIHHEGVGLVIVLFVPMSFIKSMSFLYVCMY